LYNITNLLENVTTLHSSHIATVWIHWKNILETKALFPSLSHYITSFTLWNYLPFRNNLVAPKIWNRTVL